MPRRRPSDPTLLYGLVTTLCLFGAVMGGVLYYQNYARLLAYRTDPRALSVVHTTVAARWLGATRNTRNYSLAVVAPTGGLDSLEIVGSRKRTAYETIAPGAAIAAEWFNDSTAESRPRVTAVKIKGQWLQTAWNPEYRAAGDIMAMILLGLGAPLCAWLTVRSWRRRRDAQLVVTKTFRMSITTR